MFKIIMINMSDLSIKLMKSYFKQAVGGLAAVCVRICDRNN